MLNTLLLRSIAARTASTSPCSLPESLRRHERQLHRNDLHIHHPATTWFARRPTRSVPSSLDHRRPSPTEIPGCGNSLCGVIWQRCVQKANSVPSKGIHNVKALYTLSPSSYRQSTWETLDVSALLRDYSGPSSALRVLYVGLILVLVLVIINVPVVTVTPRFSLGVDIHAPGGLNFVLFVLREGCS